MVPSDARRIRRLQLSGPAKPGKVVGPSFAAAEVVDVIEAVLDVYKDSRDGGENFIDTLQRVGFDAFKTAANAARNATARTTDHATA